MKKAIVLFSIALILSVFSVASYANSSNDVVNLDEYDTATLLNDILSPTHYIDLLPDWGNIVLSGDKRFQRVTVPNGSYVVGERHELYKSDKNDYHFSCQPTEKINPGTYTIDEQYWASWYIALPLSTDELDMNDINNISQLSKLGIRLNQMVEEEYWTYDLYPDGMPHNEHHYRVITGIVIITLRPVIVRDNCQIYDLNYISSSYLIGKEYQAGEIIPASSQVAVVVTNDNWYNVTSNDVNDEPPANNPDAGDDGPTIHYQTTPVPTLETTTPPIRYGDLGANAQETGPNTNSGNTTSGGGCVTGNYNLLSALMLIMGVPRRSSRHHHLL